MVFQIRYNMLTTKYFWNISAVSAFRGIVIAFVLALLVAFILAFALGLVINIIYYPLSRLTGG